MSIIPGRFREEGYEDITDIDIMNQIKENRVQFQKKRIHSPEALTALHSAFLNRVPVDLDDCLIGGDLLFNEGIVISPGNEKNRVIGPLTICNSEIIGKVSGGYVEFEDVCFSNTNMGPKVSFVSAIFGPSSDFRRTKLGRKPNFRGATFGDDTIFLRADFGDVANFDAAYFGNRILFGEARFSQRARFESARFGEDANFAGVDFGSGTSFRGARFKKNASFQSAYFQTRSSFNGTHFENGVNFLDARFEPEVSFEKATFGGDVNFLNVAFGDKMSFQEAQFTSNKHTVTFNRSTFGDGISFSDTKFAGKVLFVRGTFKGAATFSGKHKREWGEITKEERNTVFNGEADFRWVILEAPEKVIFQQASLKQARFLETRLDKIQFVDVEWDKRKDGRRCLYDEREAKEDEYELVAQLYRQLKKNYEDQKDYPGAGDFHYGEMEMTLKKCKQAVRKWLKSEQIEVTSEEFKEGRRKLFDFFLLRAYKALSGYGEKPGRALLWAIAILFIPAIGFSFFGVEFGNPQATLQSSIDYFGKSLGYITFRIHDMPFHPLAKVAVLIQAILGPIQLALVALALRRKFRR